MSVPLTAGQEVRAGAAVPRVGAAVGRNGIVTATRVDEPVGGLTLMFRLSLVMLMSWFLQTDNRSSIGLADHA